jgi:uncharacterized alpha-E superfamily protein
VSGHRAAHLYWLGRYIERADNLARLLDITWQMSLMPNSSADTAAALRGWQAALACMGREEEYAARHGELDASKVLHYLTVDANNPGSLYHCLRSARENAQAARAVLDDLHWQTIQRTWTDMVARSQRPLSDSEWAIFFDWVRNRCRDIRQRLAPIVRPEGVSFAALGGQLERIDYTARLLEAKYLLLDADNQDEEHSTVSDYYQWGALLRTLSALEPYQQAHREIFTPRKIAALLLLEPTLPRSLAAGCQTLRQMLDDAPQAHLPESRRLARQLEASLCNCTLDAVQETGLQHWLRQFQQHDEQLGEAIAAAR